MSARKSKSKRPVGRPPRAPQHIDVLRVKAMEGIERTRERHQGQRLIPVEQLQEKVQSLSALKKYSGKEIEELRTVVQEMYDHHVATVQEEKARDERELNETLRNLHIDLDIKPTGKSLTEAEWNALHGLRPDGTNPRGPKPRKKKRVWDLSPGERGNGTQPAEPIDLDALEREYEAEMFEREIKRKKDEPTFCVGKRLRKNNPTPRSSVDQSRFYY